MNKTNNQISSQGMVPAAVSTLNILELLSEARFSSVTLTEIASELDMHKSTCLRILKTLEEMNYVKVDRNTKEYSLGTKIELLAQRVKGFSKYKEIGQIVLQEMDYPDVTFVLVEQTKNNELQYVGVKEPNSPLRLTLSNGDTFPISFGALGKCYLAFLPRSETEKILAEVIDNGKLPQFTAKTITSPTEFYNHLQTIKDEGISISSDEFIPGITAFSCPIFDKNNNIVLGLGAYMITNSIAATNFEEIQYMLRFYANKITTNISIIK